jgi:hypothetical protein
MTVSGRDDLYNEYVIRSKKNGDMKIDVIAFEYTVVTAFIGDTVKIFRKERGYSDLCAEGTRKEYDEANNKHMPNIVYKDLKVEKLAGLTTILGYECKSAKVTYKTGGFISMNIEKTVWYTEAFKSDPDFIEATLDNKKDAYRDAVAELGYALKTETDYGGFLGRKIVSEVTEIKKLDFTPNEMDVDLAACKKALDFNHYNKQVSKRELIKQRNNGSNTIIMGK